MEKYVYLSPQISIRSYKNTTLKISYLMLEEKENRNYRQDQKIYQINEVGKEILLLLDGTLTYDGIIEHFMKKYDESKYSVNQKIAGFISQLESLGYSLCKQETPQHHEIIYSQFDNYYPTVASLELTNVCNIHCKHCYGNFGDKNVPYTLTLEQIKKIISSLSEIGLSILELTGGDPTMNPHCAEAIEFAVSSGISTVMFLTNGVFLSNRLLEVMKKYRRNLYVQIDLHSLEEEYYDWFTTSKGNLKDVKKNIDLLVSSGIKVRICSIFTPGNVDELYKIGEYAYEHGAVQFVPSVVVGIGRAGSGQGLLFENIEQLNNYKNAQNTLSVKFPGFVQDMAEIQMEGITRKNCGAIRSELSIDVFGNIKLCNMDSGDDFRLNMGNVLENSVKELFDSNKDFLDSLIEIKLPDLTEETCKSCEERTFCHNCLLRGFLAARRLYKNNKPCDWYLSLPNIVKERFPLNV